MQVLQFSGGLDSLACLWLLQDTPNLQVVTLLTDGAYPDTEAYIQKLRQRFPHLPFHVVRSYRNIEAFGAPVDVVPVRWTALGVALEGGKTRYQSVMECCARGIWGPMEKYTFRLGATVIYRGQRNSDRQKPPIQSGHIENGVEYRFPIESWSRDQVRAYVATHCSDLVPDYYRTEYTSRDCMDCTAYLKDNHTRIQNLPSPVREKVLSTLDQWEKDVLEELGVSRG